MHCSVIICPALENTLLLGTDVATIESRVFVNWKSAGYVDCFPCHHASGYVGTKGSHRKESTCVIAVTFGDGFSIKWVTILSNDAAQIVDFWRGSVPAAGDDDVATVNLPMYFSQWDTDYCFAFSACLASVNSHILKRGSNNVASAKSFVFFNSSEILIYVSLFILMSPSP